MRNTPSPLKLLFLLAALVAALALSACGDDEESVDVGDLGPDPATMAPVDAPIYAEAVIRPQGEMAENLEGALAKFGVEDPGGMLSAALDEEIASDPDSEGVTFSEDIEPWLGNRVGGFISDFDVETEEGVGAVAVAVTDPEAAQDFLAQMSESSSSDATETTYEGVDYFYDDSDDSAVGVDGDFLIAGTEDGFKQAVDAGAGDSLADDEAAAAALDEIPEDSIFSGYVDTGAVIDLVESSGALSGQQLQQFRDQTAGYEDEPVEFWTTVDDDAVTFAGSGPAPADAEEPSDLVSSFPSDAWIAVAGGNVGEQLQTSLDQFKQGFAQQAPAGFDVDPFAEFKQATGLDLETDFNWIGNFGAFAQGTSILGIGAGVVIESSDDEAAAATVDKLEAALGKQPELQITPSDSGFSIQVPGFPAGAEVALQDGKLVIAAGGASVDDVLSPSETLGDSDRFGEAQEALGEDLTPSFFFDFPPLFSLAESTGQTEADPSYQQAKPYLDALDYLIAGGSVDDEASSIGFVLGLREPEDSESTSAVLTP